MSLLLLLAFGPALGLLLPRTPVAHRASALLLASALVYAWVAPPRALLAVAVMILATHLAARAMTAPGRGAWRGWALSLGVGANVTTLLATRLLGELLDGAWSGAGAGARVAVGALGTSYVALQAVAYLADLYLEEAGEPLPLRDLALYLLFFPKVLQGPIERAGPLLSQLRSPAAPGRADLVEGLRRMAWGLFKKLVIADRLGGYVDAVYGDVGAFGGLAHLAATYLFAAQLYADFSGYTDLALGSARLLGIRLSENFDRPLRAASVAEFWRRWHMSLSRWLHDYVFTPLQIAWRGHGMAGTAGAVLVTFAVSGLWHGTTPGFLAWGCLHGAYVAIGAAVASRLARGPARRRGGDAGAVRALKALGTFHLVALGWVLFRARTLEDAWVVVTSPGPFTRGVAGLVLAQGQREAMVTSLLLAGAAAGWVLRRRTDAPAWSGFRPARHGAVRWAQYYALLLAILVLGRFGDQQFIYAGF